MTNKDSGIGAVKLFRGDAPFSSQSARDAIALLESGCVFRPAGVADGPCEVTLRIKEHRLAIEARNAAGADMTTHVVSLQPYRKLIRDYFTIIDSYEAARGDGGCARLEAIDMGRRGLHDEAAALLRERLAGKIEMDHDTARLLFTLICALLGKAF